MMANSATRERSRPTTAPTSATTTVTNPPANPDAAQNTLRLRAEPQEERNRPRERRIRWAEDVVNNEGMGKKSSKSCCIYHKPRQVGESSSEEDSGSSSSDSDSSAADDGAARPSQRRGRHGDDSCKHGHRSSDKMGAGKARKSSPNAYEKQPKSVTEKAQRPA